MLLENIRNAEHTRIWSIQDYPAAESYFIVEIETEMRSYRYFVYSEQSELYVECPYEGVYKANQQIYNFAADCFAK